MSARESRSHALRVCHALRIHLSPRYVPPFWMGGVCRWCWAYGAGRTAGDVAQRVGRRLSNGKPRKDFWGGGWFEGGLERRRVSRRLTRGGRLRSQGDSHGVCKCAVRIVKVYC